MSLYSSSDPSKTSVPSSSARSRRSGKSLSEKIRELAFNIRNDRDSLTSSNSLQYIVIKTEVNRPSDVSIMTPTLNLERIIYYQPELTSIDSVTGAKFYRIQKFETKSKGRISDIEVKSYKPLKKMTFRRKKRRSSVISRITEVLDRGKSSSLVKDPSEETVYLNLEPEQITPKNINDLPESILQKIFFYLSQQERVWNLSRVCRLWYFILKDPMFWLRLEFTGNKVPKNEIIKLIKNYTSLEILHLTSVPDIVEILQELCRCNNVLKELAIKYCPVSSQDFTRIILHVVSCCTNIEVLDIKGMEFQSERFCLTLISTKQLFVINAHVGLLAVTEYPNHESFRLHGSGFNGFLTGYNVLQATDTEKEFFRFYLVLGRLKNLRRLTLSGNKLIKNTNLITISINCRALQELRIFNINSDNLSTSLKDDDLTFIISHLQQNLKTLKMDMQQLGNISFQAIVTCWNLKNLALENCLHLTGDIFRGFTALRKLRKLKLTRAINLKPEDFQHVFNSDSMQTIEKLDINGCWGVGDAGLQAITKRLVSLRSLSLKNCKSITSKSVLHLYDCSNLVSLNVAHTKINTNQLLLLVNHMKELKELVIDLNMSKKPKVQKLRKSFPSMMIRLSLSEYRNEEQLLPSL